MLRGCLIASGVPLCVMYYYMVALPLKAPETGTNITVQANRILQTDATSQKGAFDKMFKAREKRQATAHQRARRLPPVLRVAISFVDIKRLELVRPSFVESVAIVVALGVGVFLLVIGGRRKRHDLNLCGFMILACLVSSATGILEFPGYQGRALYTMLLLFVPGLCWIGFECIVPALEGCLGQCWRPALTTGVFLCAALSCVPTVMAPPVVGGNAPVSDAVPVRQLPEDDVLVRFVLGISPNLRRTVVFVHTREDKRMRGTNVAAMNRWISETEFVRSDLPSLPKTLSRLRRGLVYAVISTPDLEAMGGWTTLPAGRGSWIPVMKEGGISVAKWYRADGNGEVR